ncbi:hypothetical protein [Sphingobacterium olei]|nr:hypothetical protein [Sphingobacterium olei]
MFNSAHPGELIRETTDGIIEETGKKLSVEEVATCWNASLIVKRNR